MISVKQNEQSLSADKETTPKLELPNLGRVFFARLFDVILTAVPSVLMTFFFLVYNWVTALIVSAVGLSVMLTYFVVLAYFFKGNTLGKLIFKLRLVRKDKKITFWALLYRETYYLFIPNLILLTTQIIAMSVFYFMNKNSGISAEEVISTTTLIQNLGYLIYVVWYFFVCITIFLQKEHQSGVDYQLKILCLLKIKAQEFQKKEIEKPKTHIHLQEKQPGIIDVEEILKDPKLEENNEGADYE